MTVTTMQVSLTTKKTALSVEPLFGIAQKGVAKKARGNSLSDLLIALASVALFYRFSLTLRKFFVHLRHRFWVRYHLVRNRIHLLKQTLRSITIIIQINHSRMNGFIPDNSHNIKRPLYQWIKALLNKRTNISVEILARFAQMFA